MGKEEMLMRFWPWLHKHKQAIQTVGADTLPEISEAVQTLLSYQVRHLEDNMASAELIREITDPKALAYIAKNAKASCIRNHAVQQITDPDVLADHAKNDRDPSIRTVAADRIMDQKVLADIAKNDASAQVRAAAVYRMTDQDMLVSIAKNDKSYSVRLSASKRVTDQQTLGELVKHEENVWVGENILPRIKDQEVLAGIVKDARAVKTQIEAIKNITDSDTLIKIAQEGDSYPVRISAACRCHGLPCDRTFYRGLVSVKTLTEQTEDPLILRDIAANEPDTALRLQALRRVPKTFRDQAFLAEIIRNGGNRKLRCMAAELLTDTDQYSGLFMSSRDNTVWRILLGRIRDRDFLTAYASQIYGHKQRRVRKRLENLEKHLSTD
jgi:hypothetical protein